jgi:taurine transport system ATP-binding protein
VSEPLGVQIAGLEHRFEAHGSAPVQAIDRVDLTIEPGEFVALAGPSGCGKSTLLRIIAGLQKPTTGSVLVGGSPVDGPGTGVGVVFQQPTLYPWMNVIDNVALGLKLRGVAKAERYEKAGHYLELVGLSDFAKHRHYELSGGMQQRAQIARVLAGEPSLILMDEPFSALDALTRERLQEELLSIWRRTGTTVLFITHGVDEAVFLGTRVLVMSPRPGRIVLDVGARFSSTDQPVAPAEIRNLPAFIETVQQVRAAITA